MALAVEFYESVDNVVKSECGMFVDISNNSIVEVLVPMFGNVLEAYASADDTADSCACAVVIKTDCNTVTYALCIIFSAEHKGENDSAHIVYCVHRVHSGEVFIKKLTSADVVCNFFFSGECPFKLFVKL